MEEKSLILEAELKLCNAGNTGVSNEFSNFSRNNKLMDNYFTICSNKLEPRDFSFNLFLWQAHLFHPRVNKLLTPPFRTFCKHSRNSKILKLKKTVKF